MHRTEAGGFTERRYTPMDVLELQVPLDLRWRGFSIPKIRHLLEALREAVGIRLYEPIGDAGRWPSSSAATNFTREPLTGGCMMDCPTEPLLMVEGELPDQAAGRAEHKRRRARSAERRPRRPRKAG